MQLPFRIYRRDHIPQHTDGSVCSFSANGREKEKDVLLRDSKTSALISLGVAISQIPGTSPRSTLSPSFFCFFFFFFLARIGSYVRSWRAFFSRLSLSTPMLIIVAFDPSKMKHSITAFSFVPRFFVSLKIVEK